MSEEQIKEMRADTAVLAFWVGVILSAVVAALIMHSPSYAGIEAAVQGCHHAGGVPEVRYHHLTDKPNAVICFLEEA